MVKWGCHISINMNWYCAFYLILFCLFFHGGFCEDVCWGVVRDAGHLVICLLGSPVARGAVSPWERRQRRDGEGGANLFISKNHMCTHWHHQSKSAPFNQKLINIHILWEKSVRISNTTKAARWGSLRKYRREYKNEMNIWTSKQMPNWTWYNMTRPKAEQVLNAAVLWKITS